MQINIQIITRIFTESTLIAFSKINGNITKQTETTTQECETCTEIQFSVRSMIGINEQVDNK